MKVEKIIILTTGGTIEKSYDEGAGFLGNRESFIKDKLTQKLRMPYTKLEVFSILNKDSLEMTDNDRELINLFLQNKIKENHPIVITHGTDTMDLTARYCFERLKNVKIPIIFTGAMKPMGFEDSDAIQNITEAIFASKIVSAGLYISFHNQLFKVPAVRKNKDKGTFEDI